MPYVKTGRPPGRPRTKEYVTLMARVPQDIVDQVTRYKTIHRQSTSEVLRDALTMLLEEDRYRPFVSDRNAKQEILSDVIPTPAVPSDTNGTQESMSDTIHQQRLREIVYDMNDDTPEPEIASDMNSIEVIMSDTNGVQPVPLAPADMGTMTADTQRTQRRALLLSEVPWQTDKPEGISPADIRRVTGMSRTDVTNDLAQLCKQGQVEKVEGSVGCYVRPGQAPIA